MIDWSERAGKRVMEGISDFLTRKFKLKVEVGEGSHLVKLQKARGVAGRAGARLVF
jgi:hypothetical protein